MRKKRLIGKDSFGMSAFVLKIVAMFTMTCDHLSYLIFGKFSFLNLIGRIAFPIFAYQITEGYTHTHNLKKYFLRLFVFALISQAPFMFFASLVTNEFSLNIFFTLLFGLTAITIFDNLSSIECKNKYMHLVFQICGILVCFIIAFLGYLVHVDYGYFGVLAIFVFYLFRNHKVYMNLAFTALVFGYYGKYLLIPRFFGTYLSIIACTLFALVFINLYNHKKGKDTKYFLYLFYPLHLLIIYALSFVL